MIPVLKIHDMTPGRRSNLVRLKWGKFQRKTGDFWLDWHGIEAFNCESLSPRLVDLTCIAAAVYAADRYTKRPHMRSPGGWGRHINVELPVYEPHFWSGETVQRLLSSALAFLTDDTWRFSFTENKTPADSQKPLFDKPDASAHFLYSGGLDSAAGLVRYAQKNPKQIITPVLVGHRTDLPRLVRKQLARIRETFPNILNPLAIVCGMRKPPAEEKTQRTRNFLFLSVAGASASCLHGDSVQVGENGVGAINFPLSTIMTGALSTKGTHPYFLSLMFELMSAVQDGRPFSYELPNLDCTKGELLAHFKAAGLESIVEDTLSCSHIQRNSAAKQCGRCVACVFRRQSLHAAGIADPKHQYVAHLFDKGESHIHKEGATALKFFLGMVDRIADEEQLQAYLLSTNIQPTKAIFSLFRRYRAEWISFCNQCKREKWAWAQYMMPKGVTV